MLAIRIEGARCSFNRFGEWECPENPALARVLNKDVGLNSVNASDPEPLLTRARVAISFYPDGELLSQ